MPDVQVSFKPRRQRTKGQTLERTKGQTFSPLSRLSEAEPSSIFGSAALVSFVYLTFDTLSAR